MQLHLAAALVAVAAVPAMACPVGAPCASARSPALARYAIRGSADAAREEVPAAPRRTIELRVAAPAARDPWRLEVAPPRQATVGGLGGEVDMPWIWQVLRREVYAQMPRYRDDAVTFVLSPVVVTGSFDTVPGVGVAGDF